MHNHHKYFCDLEREVWKPEEEKVSYVKPIIQAVLVAVPLVTVLTFIWVALP